MVYINIYDVMRSEVVMKAVKIEKPGDISLVEVEMPVAKENEAVIRIIAAGICGSDIGAFRGVNNLVSYPRIIGHELVGEVVSIPFDVKNEKNIQTGDKVILEPYLFCGHCYPCSKGRTNCCTNLKVLGVHQDGGIAEYITHPANMLLKLPEKMDLTIAPIVEPLSIALHGLHRLRILPGEQIAIFGAGTIGLLAALVAIAYDAIPILIDVLEPKLTFARKIGIRNTIHLASENLIEKINALTNSRGCECVMEASGANAAIRAALDVVSFAGRIALTGWPKVETQLPTDLITKKEVDILGARNSAGEFEEAINLIYSGKVDAKAILTKTISLEDVPSVLRDIDQNPSDYLKVNIIV